MFCLFCVTEFMHEDERGLYEKLSQMLNEDEASTVIDLPGKKHIFKCLKCTHTNTHTVRSGKGQMLGLCL